MDFSKKLKTVSYEELESVYREYKLNHLLNNNQFNIDYDFLKKEKYLIKFLYNNFRNDIITGSFALKIYGLIERSYSDIDLILIDGNPDEFTTINSRYTNTSKFFKEEYIGYNVFRYRNPLLKKNINIDAFKYTEQSYIEVKYKNYVLKIHKPLEIIKKKMELSRESYKTSVEFYISSFCHVVRKTKDVFDVKHIFNLYEDLY